MADYITQPSQEKEVSQANSLPDHLLGVQNREDQHLVPGGEQQIDVGEVQGAPVGCPEPNEEEPHDGAST